MMGLASYLVLASSAGGGEDPRRPDRLRLAALRQFLLAHPFFPSGGLSPCLPPSPPALCADPPYHRAIPRPLPRRRAAALALRRLGCLRRLPQLLHLPSEPVAAGHLQIIFIMFTIFPHKPLDFLANLVYSEIRNKKGGDSDGPVYYLWQRSSCIGILSLPVNRGRHREQGHLPHRDSAMGPQISSQVL